MDNSKKIIITNKEIENLYKFHKDYNGLLYEITISDDTGIGQSISIEVEGQSNTGRNITDYTIW